MSLRDKTGSKAAPFTGNSFVYTHNLLHFARPNRMMNL
jgi:hypothetical protein